MASGRPSEEEGKNGEALGPAEGTLRQGDSPACPGGLCRDLSGRLWLRATLHPGQPEATGPEGVDSWGGVPCWNSVTPTSHLGR